VFVHLEVSKVSSVNTSNTFRGIQRTGCPIPPTESDAQPWVFALIALALIAAAGVLVLVVRMRGRKSTQENVHSKSSISSWAGLRKGTDRDGEAGKSAFVRT
jgi:hypothetical protein